MEMRTLVAEVARKARLPEWRMFALMAAANARPLDVLGNGIGAREWTTLMVTGTLTSFIALLVPTYVVTNSPELALLFATITALLLGYALFMLPSLLAARRSEEMERALPGFLSALVSVYSTTRNMRTALIETADADHGAVSRELRQAVTHYELTGDEGEAFRRLTNGVQKKNVKAAFELVSASLATGIDVSDSLNLLAKGVSASLEAQDDKNAKTGIMTWSMVSASAFFFPFIAAIGYDALLMLEKLNGAPLYADSEKGLLLFTLAAYALLSVAQDAMFIGSVRSNSIARGMAAYFPLLAFIAMLVMAVVVRMGGVLL